MGSKRCQPHKKDRIVVQEEAEGDGTAEEIAQVGAIIEGMVDDATQVGLDVRETEVRELLEHHVLRPLL